VVVSALATLILLAVTLSVAIAVPEDAAAGVPRALVVLLGATVLLVSALFTVRGYEVGTEEVGVRRLLWTTRLSLAGLREAWADPSALARSLRLFGNGGLFSFTGLFWNRRLGRYRAFATDPRRAVVMRFGARSVVVTPDDPDAFVAELAHRRPWLRTNPPAPPG
jgi:hypothetical protein